MPEQTVPIDFYYYHDGNLPFPLPNIGSRLRSKYIKIQMHKFLPEYDIYIWIDGRCEILSKDFVKEMLIRLGKNDIAMFKHKERKNVYDEIDFILSKIKIGNRYLTTRYANQSLDKEKQFYIDNGLPEDFQLYGSGIFIRKNNKKVNVAFDEWWMRSIEFSYFDQAMFSFITFAHKLKINSLTWDPIRTIKEIIYHTHKK